MVLKQPPTSFITRHTERLVALSVLSVPPEFSITVTFILAYSVVCRDLLVCQQ